MWLNDFKWDIIEHLPYFLHLALQDYRLFKSLQKMIATEQVKTSFIVFFAPKSNKIYSNKSIERMRML